MASSNDSLLRRIKRLRNQVEPPPSVRVFTISIIDGGEKPTPPPEFRPHIDLAVYLRMFDFDGELDTTAPEFHQWCVSPK